MGIEPAIGQKRIARIFNHWLPGNDKHQRFNNGIFKLRLKLETTVRQINDLLTAFEHRPGCNITGFEQNRGNSGNRTGTDSKISRQDAYNRNGKQVLRGEARTLSCSTSQ